MDREFRVDSWFVQAKDRSGDEGTKPISQQEFVRGAGSRQHG